MTWSQIVKDKKSNCCLIKNKWWNSDNRTHRTRIQGVYLYSRSQVQRKPWILDPSVLPAHLKPWCFTHRVKSRPINSTVGREQREGAHGREERHVDATHLQMTFRLTIALSTVTHSLSLSVSLPQPRPQYYSLSYLLPSVKRSPHFLFHSPLLFLIVLSPRSSPHWLHRVHTLSSPTAHH